MCSIVGYVGDKSSRLFVFDGLTHLEYRGYDSAGFVCFDGSTNRLVYTKCRGNISHLRDNLESMPIDGAIGMGHTRWSTHGAPTAENTHPHFDCKKALAIVHNGIIENCVTLRSELSRTHHFNSQTDSEVIAHLFEEALLYGNSAEDALYFVTKRLSGVYAFCALAKKWPDQLLLARKRSPLYIGYGEDQMFVASDTAAFAGWTHRVLSLPDESVAVVNQNSVRMYTFDGASIEPRLEIINDIFSQKNVDTSLLKTVYNSKRVMQRTVALCKDYQEMESVAWQLGLEAHEIQRLSKIHLFGSGSSYHSALIARFFFEKIAMIPTIVHLGSEFRHLPFFPEPRSIAFALSQSGKTTDTLESIRFLNAHNVHTVAITHDNTTDMAREARGHILTGTSTEIASAELSKTFLAQLTIMYWLAHWISFKHRMITRRHVDEALNQALVVAELLESVIEKYKQPIVDRLALYYAQSKYLIFLGRHISYPFALEAAHTLKENAYIFVDCLPAGELMYGHLTLIDDQIPVVLFSCLDSIVYQKLVKNAKEVKARSGHLVVFAFENQHELLSLADCAFAFPAVQPLLAPFVMTGLMKLFAYGIARVLKRSLDKQSMVEKAPSSRP